MNSSKSGVMHIPDQRSPSGRYEVTQRFLNHYNSMKNINPEIKSREKPRDHVDKQKKIQNAKEYNNQQVHIARFLTDKKFDEVRETQRRTHNIKKAIDNSRPITHSRSQAMSKNKKAKETQQNGEHLTRLQHMQNRMNFSHSKTERKKNANDPIAHPPQFHRKKSQNDPGMLMTQTLQKAAVQTSNLSQDSMDMSKTMLKRNFSLSDLSSISAINPLSLKSARTVTSTDTNNLDSNRTNDILASDRKSDTQRSIDTPTIKAAIRSQKKSPGPNQQEDSVDLSNKMMVKSSSSIQIQQSQIQGDKYNEMYDIFMGDKSPNPKNVKHIDRPNTEDNSLVLQKQSDNFDRDLKELKRRIVDQIVKNMIFNELELEKVFIMTEESNRHLDKEVIAKAIVDVRKYIQ